MCFGNDRTEKSDEGVSFFVNCAFFHYLKEKECFSMKKMCYLLTMGLLAGSLTVPVFAASDAETDKKWTIATDTVFKPFEYTDDSGNFVGIDVDVLDAIAKDQGFEYELVRQNHANGTGVFHCDFTVACQRKFC